MSNAPNELKYTKTHEWIRTEADGSVTVGITDHAQELLGDMVFIELPETGTNFTPGNECAVVESVKAASDIYCPINGEITEINEQLADTPEIINQAPYGDGWLFRLKPEDTGEINDLMDADTYIKFSTDEQ
jgi:glycine cleavage system H protein